MYNLTEYVQQESQKQPTAEQIRQMKQTQQYLRKHKIHQLFNQLVSQLVETKPQNPKQGMIEILKQIKNKVTYFKKSDFEQLFDSYNFFEQKADNKIPYNYLIQALRRINIYYEKPQFLEKYPKFKLDRMIEKTDFVNIMEQQYKALTKFDY